MGATEDQALSKEDPSSDEEYEGLNSWRTSYPLRNDVVMNEEYDEAKGLRRSLPTNKIKEDLVRAQKAPVG